MNPPTRYTANPTVSCGDEQDGAVLFNPDANDTVVINLTGRALWAFLETPRTVDEMTTYLTDTYQGVSTEQAAEDAAQFVQSLMPNFLSEIDNDD